MSREETESHDFANIRVRIKQKRKDYIRYDFSRKKNDILKTFFDLAQEFDTIPDLFRICVAAPQDAFGVDSKLYLINDNGLLELVCDSEQGVYPSPLPCPEDIIVSDKSYEKGQSYLVPIYSKSLQFSQHDKPAGPVKVIGMFEVMPLEKLTQADKFFFTKYTNRIGYNLRKKILTQRNINHLKFINNLVDDIEHNVIIPNMYYKHLFNQLRRHIDNLNELSDMVWQYKKEESGDYHRMCQIIIDKITEIKDRLNSSYKDINKHYINLSLFLESLLRRDHFEKGYFVLRQRICKLDSEIIAPQLENYEKRMLMRGITIERPEDMPGEGIEINADLGLLSQVYANLFSNALKYTRKVITDQGKPRKAVTYGRKVLNDYFGPGRPGIKLNVFSTGNHIPAHENESLFEEGFMGRNHTEDLSRGHGLAFIKYVVEVHGGVVGYEPTPGGNNFYFILPLIQQHN